MNKALKITGNIVYGIGVIIAIGLGATVLFGSNVVLFPDAMIPYTLRELAFIWLGIGSIPTLLACMAVYKFNAMKNSSHKKRNFILIFLPFFICAACALLIIGVIAFGMINSFVFDGALTR